MKTDYKITNTTKWPGVKKGKHRNGFIVAIQARNLHVGRHMFVEKMTEGIEALQERKYIKVESVADRNVTIKEKVENIEKENEAERKAAEAKMIADSKKAKQEAELKLKQETEALNKETEESRPASSFDKDEMKAQVKGGMSENTARVPDEGQSEDPLGDLEDVAGDNPNFVVQAGKKKNKGNKSNRN